MSCTCVHLFSCFPVEGRNCEFNNIMPFHYAIIQRKPLTRKTIKRLSVELIGIQIILKCNGLCKITAQVCYKACIFQRVSAFSVSFMPDIAVASPGGTPL